MPKTLLEYQTLFNFVDWIQIGWMLTHRFHDILVHLLGWSLCFK